jgi:hypothetical protein
MTTLAEGHGVDHAYLTGHHTVAEGHGAPHSYVHDHPYLPTGRIFSPTKPGEDPRLFDGDHLRPEVRSFVLEEIGRDWDDLYPDWPSWGTVYLAGGEASHWYGSGAAHGEGEEADDFDVLVMVDMVALATDHPEFDGRPQAEIAQRLTQHFREGFDVRNERAQVPGVAGTYGMTAYVNPISSRDIGVLNPYAAYDISDDRWAVRPVETAPDWSAASLPEYLWDALEGLLKYVDAIREMPEPLRTREGAHLFDDLHSDRTEAFGPEGEGVFDPANVIWKSLDLHPSQPLEFLVGCKRRSADSAKRHTDSKHTSLSQSTASWQGNYDQSGVCSCCDGRGVHLCGHGCARCDGCGRESEASGPACTSEHADGVVRPCACMGPRKTAEVRHVRREDSPEPEGIMVAIVPPRSVVDDIVVEGGETPDNIHVTLAYLGNVAEYRRQHLDDVVEVVRAWAELQHPWDCRLQGAGTFVNPDAHVLWAAVDVPGLHRVHASLVDYLRVHGYRPHEDHSFTPHITLSYEKHHVRFLPKITPVEWVTREVWVVVGGRWESVPLGAGGA